MERGTLYQLRNLINRRNVTKCVKNDVNANEDFLEVCFTGYLIAAVMSLLGMTDMNGMPISSMVSPDSWMEDKSVQSSILMKIASRLVDTNVDMHTDFCDSSDIGTEAQLTKESCTVQSYTKEVLSLGLLFLNFKDAIKEGDGIVYFACGSIFCFCSELLNILTMPKKLSLFSLNVLLHCLLIWLSK